MLSKIYEDMKQNKFFIMGNGGSGTSLLRGLLNAHSKIDCTFENIQREKSFEENNAAWSKLRDESSALRWGNKVPYEQFLTGKWGETELCKIAEHYKIIWIVRRFTRYSHNAKGQRLETYRTNWIKAQELYFNIKDGHPDTVIMVSFEDLILRPVAEMRRICDFLNVDFENTMLNGTMHTGFSKYNQSNINIEKL